MNKRAWWKAAAAATVCGVGVAFADSPKIENAVWTRASTPVAAPTPAAPAPAPVTPASASTPAPVRTPTVLPTTPNYPLPPKSSSDSVVLPEFRPAAKPPVVVPVATLPSIVLPPNPPPTTVQKVPVQPPIPPAVVEQPKPIVLPEPAPSLKVPPPASVPEVVKPALPPLPELAPPAQPVKSADPVKPVPPAAPDFNLRPAPGGNSVNLPMLPAVPATPVPPAIEGPGVVKAPPAPEVSRPKPVDGPMPKTDKYVFPIPEKAPIARPQPPAIPATLPKGEMPEVPSVPVKPLPTMIPTDMVPVPMIFPGVPTAIERPVPPKTELNTIPQPGVDPMTLKQKTMAAVFGSALALAPASVASAFPLPIKPSPVAAQPGTKTTDEKLADAQKEIKRLGELLDGRKDTDGKPSPVDVGAVEDIKRLKDDVFRLKEKVASLESQLLELKKSTTSLKPAPVDPMAGKGMVRVENDYPIEITIVVNAMSYRVPANTKLDIPVPVGDFTYQLLNSGTGLAPVKSPIKEKEVVKLRIK